METKTETTKKYYYLYVFSTDINGNFKLIQGKLFFDIGSAIDYAKHNYSFPGFHVQLVETSKNEIVYQF